MGPYILSAQPMIGSFQVEVTIDGRTMHTGIPLPYRSTVSSAIAFVNANVLGQPPINLHLN